MSMSKEALLDELARLHEMYGDPRPDEDCFTSSEYAERVGIETNMAYNNLKRMERAGVVERVKSPVNSKTYWRIVQEGD